MALVAVDEHAAAVPAAREDPVGQLLLLMGRVQAVAGDRRGEHRHVDAAQRGGDAAPAPPDVVQVHRPVEHHIGVGVEAPHQLLAVMVQIRLHLEAAPQVEVLLRVVQPPSEPALEGLAGPVGHLGDLAGHRQAHPGPLGLVVVVAVVPSTVGGDGQPLHRAPGELQGAGRGAGGQGQDRPHPPGVHGRPLQDLHASHRAAGHSEPAADPEVVGQQGLRPDHVADRHHREAGPVAPAVGRVDVGGAGRALAAAHHVAAHHEVAVGVDRLARADHVGPPARSGMGRAAVAGRVRVPGERVAHQHRVGGPFVEPAPGLVGQPHLGQPAAPLQREGPAVGDGHEPAVAGGVAGLPGAGDRQPGREAPPGAGSPARGSRRLDVGTCAQPCSSSPVLSAAAPPGSTTGGRTGYSRASDFGGCSPEDTWLRRLAGAASPPGGGMAPWVSAPGCRARPGGRTALDDVTCEGRRPV